MIKSKTDYNFYLEADRIANGIAKERAVSRIRYLVFKNEIFGFLKLLRKLEYLTNVKRGLVWKLYRKAIYLKFKRYSLKLGFSIPPNVFGPGLSIAHYGTIIVNSGAKIGSNCRLHACVNIGTEAGYSNKAPTIGDNCYIGPGSVIYGSVVIGDGNAIGANALVNKSFLESGSVIAGVPAKVIGTVDTDELLIPATKIMALGLHERCDIQGLPAKEIAQLVRNSAHS